MSFPGPGPSSHSPTGSWAHQGPPGKGPGAGVQFFSPSNLSEAGTPNRAATSGSGYRGSINQRLRLALILVATLLLKSSLNWWHRLSSLCQGSRLVVHSLERLCHQPIPAFHVLRVGQRPMRNCSEKFLRICRTAAPVIQAQPGKPQATKTILWFLV